MKSKNPTKFRSLWGAAKMVLRGRFVALNVFSFYRKIQET